MKKIWQNERSKAGIMLALWIIFIILIISISSCSLKSDKSILENDSKEEITIAKRIGILFAKPLNYKITYVNDNNTLVYDVSFNNGEYTGYKETIDGITKFKCNLEKCYVVYIDHEEEIEDYYFKDDLDIFNIKSIANDLVLNNDYYSFAKDNKSYKVYIENDNITRIVIEEDTIKVVYDINYNY